MLRANLDKYSNATVIHAIHAISDDANNSRIARIAKVQVASPLKTDLLGSDVLVSNWWLLHFANLNPVQVAVWPPSTHAEVLAFNPTALSARPIPSPIDETVEMITND